MLKILFGLAIIAWVFASDQWLGRMVFVAIALAAVGVVRWARR